jgi:hypothetical protein
MILPLMPDEDAGAVLLIPAQRGPPSAVIGMA